ncbi:MULTISPECIES: 6-phosphofructokinase [Methanoculleus]|uniref:6-phosphofructokinase n=2 Tax=Methanoculleus TaxID=45989 RepID=A3CU10_METMJ|nr:MULTISPECIES: 6-phosphofructokinase [Methanoculleus]ABN56860.1 6-phosphofructokinase [Methanoculleus marisnigri JR1]MCC7556527.1 6-phosphofructokinase [Methanoculleus marisnigri]UYU18289.1 6-phosphofructokinase [Methanoculleus submarinus]
MKRIGILTSGGDAPGMNACIRAAVRTALANDLAVVGIRRGYTGLIAGDAVPLDRSAIRNTIHLGGTILETSRNQDFYTREGRLRAAAAIDRMGLDGIVLIGGEGTFHGASLLAADADTAALVGVPASIDNDVYGTDYCIGFDTAANCAVEAIDRIRDTARSHDRLFFIEVMGRTAGFLALESGIAGGAEELVIPEEEVSVARISDRIERGFTIGKKSAIVVVAEGKTPGISFSIAREVGERLNFESRVVVLGHLQRGGPPTLRDRVLGSLLGFAAVEALMEGRSGCMVGEIGGNLTYTPLEETWQKKKPLDKDLRRIFPFLSE